MRGPPEKGHGPVRAREVVGVPREETGQSTSHPAFHGSPGMAMETRLTDKFVTQVPARIRKDEGLEPGETVVRWKKVAAGVYEVRFRKRMRLRDLIGTMPGASGGDALRAKLEEQERI